MTDPSPPVRAPLTLLAAADLIAMRVSTLPAAVTTTAFVTGWNGAVNALRDLAAQEVRE